MTPDSELNIRNYKRIAFINWLLSLPILLIFAWPYFFLSELLSVNKALSFPGSILFGLPFMLTILHGHVTMALGAAHRSLYYSWLSEAPFTYGLLFHEMIISTRFRLVLFGISLVILLSGLAFR